MPTVMNAEAQTAAQKDFLPLQGTDYVEFYVGNAKQAAHFYKTAFGFQDLAYAGPETGVKDRASYAVRQNKLTFVFTTPLRSSNAIADHIYKHGDGVKALALRVDDAADAWKQTTDRGARLVFETDILDENKAPSHAIWLQAMAWSFGAFVVGSLLFMSREREFAVRI